MDFNKCTLANLEEQFGLRQVQTLPPFEAWQAIKADVSEFEIEVLSRFRQSLRLNHHDWNEAELVQNFIGPVFTLVNFTTPQFNLFAERLVSGTVQGTELRGYPDGMIASGYRVPKTPYFCFQEYKKHKDPDGDPAGQALSAMLVAQELNGYQHPVYGCHVIGAIWYFMALQNDAYYISQPLVATDDDLIEIFRLLKALKQIVTQFVG